MLETLKVNGLALVITTACNTRCRRCYRHLDPYMSGPPVMTLETAQQATKLFLDNVMPTGGDIMLFGGEPLVNWELMVRYITWFRGFGAPRNIFVITVTNGLALTREKIDFLRDHDALSLTLSLDGDYAIHAANRDISREEFDHIITMMRYAMQGNPLAVTPFCVLQRRTIGDVYRNLSFIASFGVGLINVIRDQFEDWSEEERDAVVSQMAAVAAQTGAVIQPFCESIFDCTTCRAPAIMVYPNGDIYDACFTCASVLRFKGLISDADSRCVFLGNVGDTHKLLVDLAWKRAIIRSRTYCPLVHEDIHRAMERLSGGRASAVPRFRVMDILPGRH